METNRLEAFSDGVLAIIITIMVLELDAPDGAELSALREVVPHLLIYLMSFVYLGIYWNNHHHMLAVTRRVSGSVLWANLHLLFWLSLVPFVTAWMGDSHFAPGPTAAYGCVLLAAAVAYYVLQGRILALEGRDSVLAQALGGDWKGKVSPVLYVVGILSAFAHQAIAGGIYILVALIWLVPDTRIERAVARAHGPAREPTQDPM